MTKISIAIMAHPKRAIEAKNLFHALQGNFSDVTCVFDTDNNEWATGKDALLAYDPKADWHIVIQDDAIISENFQINVFNALSNPIFKQKKTLVSFYFGKTRPFVKQTQRAVDRAQLINANWIQTPGLFWGVCIAIPRKDIEKLVAQSNDSQEPYDNRIGLFYTKRNRPIYNTYPSLVDHTDAGSIIPMHDVRASGRRVAYDFAGGMVFLNDRIIEMDEVI